MNVDDETPNERSTSSYRPPSATQRTQCAVCQREGHRVYECEQFKAADVDERWKFINTKSLCRTCPNNHGKWPCKSWQGCRVDGCRLKQHQLLHPTVATEEVVSACASHTNEVNAISPLFRILPVPLHHYNTPLTIYAFVDVGS